MLAKGADLYAITKDRMMAIQVCAKWGNEVMLRKLIEKKLDVAKAAGANASWPIHFACERKSKLSYAVVHCLLQTNKACRLAADKRKSMPIHQAIRAENVPVIQLLLDKDPELQIRKADGDGNTPMHLAAQRGEL